MPTKTYKHTHQQTQVTVMYKSILIALLGLPFTLTEANADIPIKNIDVFEKNYISCIEGNYKNDCFSKAFDSHFTPWTSSETKDTERYRNFLENWARKVEVYKVHKITTSKLGNVAEKRFYVVELTNGSLAAFNVRYRSIKGEWYVFDLQVSNDGKIIEKLFFGDFIPPNYGFTEKTNQTFK